MAIKLNGSTSGSVALDAPADTSPSGTDVTLTLPTSAGSSGQYLQTNGSGTLSWQTVTDTDTFGLTHLTTVSTSSQSSVTVTGIPATATMVYVNIDNFGTATSSASRLEMQVGNGSIDSGTNRYSWTTSWLGPSNDNGTTTSSGSTRFQIFDGAMTSTGHKNVGTIQLLRTDDRGWIMTSSCGDLGANGYVLFAQGRYNQDTAIDRVRLYNPSANNISDGSLIMVSYQ